MKNQFVNSIELGRALGLLDIAIGIINDCDIKEPSSLLARKNTFIERSEEYLAEYDVDVRQLIKEIEKIGSK